MIKLKVKSFITHKKSETLDACQDAWAAIFSINLEQDQEQRIERYAVADGATRSFYPKQWAELLVNNFCEATELTLAEENWEEWICPSQKEWYEQIEERVNKLNRWFLTNRFNRRESAVSTFIGLEIDKSNAEWKAMIIGDSCLFHRSDTEFKSYLIENSADFTNRPEAFASFPKDNPIGSPPEFISDIAKPGDTFILATDALAKWIVQHKEAGKLAEVLCQLNELETDEQFYQFVDVARQDTEMPLVNDDVTLMLISVESVPQQDDIETETQENTKPEIQEDIESETQKHIETEPVSDVQDRDASQQESNFLSNLGKTMLYLIPGIIVLIVMYLILLFITDR